jgi:hypothetical protein
MKRWELITSDNYLIATIECIVVSGKGIKQTRKELNDILLKYRDELLQGNKEQSNTLKKTVKQYGSGRNEYYRKS